MTSTEAEVAAKSALRIGDASTLNVYIMGGGGSLGWAYFPNNYANSPILDGVVVDYRTLPNGNLPPYNLGDTLVHEVGHWLGLYHTFSGGCNENMKKGDKIPDTPAEKTATYGCPSSPIPDSCPGTTGGLAGSDPIFNFMDYTDDACMYEFTRKQKKRMKKQWFKFRSNTLV